MKIGHMFLVLFTEVSFIHKCVPCSWTILSPSYEDYYWSFILFLQWHLLFQMSPHVPKCFLLFTTNAHLSYLYDSFAFSSTSVDFLSFSLACGLLDMYSNTDFSLYFWHSLLCFSFLLEIDIFTVMILSLNTHINLISSS